MDVFATCCYQRQACPAFTRVNSKKVETRIIPVLHF